MGSGMGNTRSGDSGRWFGIDDREGFAVPPFALMSRGFALSLLIDPTTSMASFRNQNRIPPSDQLELARAIASSRFLARHLLLLALEQFFQDVGAGFPVGSLGVSHAIANLNELLVDVLEAGSDGIADCFCDLLLHEASGKGLEGLVKEVML